MTGDISDNREALAGLTDVWPVMMEAMHTQPPGEPGPEGFAAIVTERAAQLRLARRSPCLWGAYRRRGLRQNGCPAGSVMTRHRPGLG